MEVDWTALLSEEVQHVLTDANRYIVHVPNLRLDSGPIDIPSLGLTLVNLSWAAWKGLDHWFATRPTSYTSRAPTFAVFESACSEEKYKSTVDALYIVLAAAAPVRMQYPHQSMTYQPSRGGVTRFIGPYGREPILTGVGKDFTLPIHERPALDRHSFLLLRDPSLLTAPEVRFAVSALARGALIGIDDASGAALCAIALEELTMAGRSTQLTATFVRRVGTLLAATNIAEEVDGANLARQIYALRGQTLHGQPGQHDVDWAVAINATRRVLAKTLILAGALLDDQAITTFSPALLGEALDTMAVSHEKRLI